MYPPERQATLHEKWRHHQGRPTPPAHRSRRHRTRV